MPALTKLTPKAIKAIRSFHEEGLSLRAIQKRLLEEGLPSVSHERIRKVLEKKPPPGLKEADLLLAEPLPDDSAPIEFVREQLKFARQLVSRTARSVASDEYPAEKWGSLVKLTTFLADRVAEHERRLPVKPEDDPSNQKLRDTLLAEVTSRTLDAEAARGGLCPGCMRARTS